MIASIKAFFVVFVKTWIIPYQGYGLFVMAVAESSFFPIPPDFALIPLAFMKPENALILALICTIGSTLGGMLGYLIGKFGGRPILEKFVKTEKIDVVHNYFEKYNVWAIGIAGFTPIPYKIFTIAAGMFKISFFPFVLASFVSRGARFFIVGGLIYKYGDEIRPFLEKHFDVFSIGMVVLLFLGFFALKLFSGKVKDSDKETDEEIVEIEKAVDEV